MVMAAVLVSTMHLLNIIKRVTHNVLSEPDPPAFGGRRRIVGTAVYHKRSTEGWGATSL